MSITNTNPLYYLKKRQSVHWFLFGIRSNFDAIYFVEIIGNDSTKTQVLPRKDARYTWAKLLTEGFEKVDLKDAGAIPFHVDQRIREWWKFVSRGFRDKFYGDDPWGSSMVDGNDPKTLSEIAEGKFSDKLKEEAAEQEDDWEYSYTANALNQGDYSADLDKGDGDIDNYWNTEGAFESASDKSDEYAVMMENMMIDPPEPEWDNNDCEEDEQEHNESYQRWAIDGEKRDEEIEQAIEEYYASEDS